MITVCKDCKDRHIGCHSDCDKYIADKADNERKRAIIKHEKDKIADAKAFRDDCFIKIQRSRGKRA